MHFHYLLGLHCTIGLDSLYMLVALEGLDGILREFDAVIVIQSVFRRSYQRCSEEDNVRKALDKAVLVSDLSALVDGVLLGPFNCQYLDVLQSSVSTYALTWSSDASSLQVT